METRLIRFRDSKNRLFENHADRQDGGVVDARVGQLIRGQSADISQIGAAQVGPVENRAGDVGAAQGGVGQHRVREVGAGQVGGFQHRPGEIVAGEVLSGEIDADESGLGRIVQRIRAAGIDRGLGVEQGLGEGAQRHPVLDDASGRGGSGADHGRTRRNLQIGSGDGVQIGIDAFDQRGVPARFSPSIRDC